MKQKLLTTPPVPPDDSPPPLVPAAINKGSSLWLWWGLILVLMITLLWPMARAQYYMHSGVEAAPSAVTWRTDFQAALAEAKESRKRLLLVFSASWCPPCNVMKHEVWPDEEVGKLANANYIPVLLDPLPNQDVAERFEVQYIPTILVVSPEQRTLARGSAMSARAMKKFLEKHAGKSGH